jgi:hypothetical protein
MIEWKERLGKVLQCMYQLLSMIGALGKAHDWLDEHTDP